MKYRTLYPILHSGQPIPVGAVFTGTDAFGKAAKSPLDVDRLLVKGRIEAVPELGAEAPDGPVGDPPSATSDPTKGKEPRK